MKSKLKLIFLKVNIKRVIKKEKGEDRFTIPCKLT